MTVHETKDGLLTIPPGDEIESFEVAGLQAKLVRGFKDATCGKGFHGIMIFEGQPTFGEVGPEAAADLLRASFAVGQQISEVMGWPGRFRLEINGPAAAKQSHLHVHVIIFPTAEEGFKPRRCVDPIEQGKTGAEI